MLKIQSGRASPRAGLQPSAVRRFFMLYLSFFLAFALLFTLFFNAALEALSERTRHTSEETLRAGLARLESTLESFQTAALSLYGTSSVGSLAALRADALDNAFAPGRDVRGYYSVLTARQDFAAAAVYLPVKTDMGLILRNGVVLTQNRCHLNGGAFYPAYLECQNSETFADWFDFLIGGADNTLRPLRYYTTYDNKSYRALTYSLAMPLGTAAQSTVFYATVSESALLSLLLPGGTLSGGILTLKNAAGETLYAGEGREDTVYAETVRITGDTGLTAELRLPAGASRAELAGFYRVGAQFASGYLLLGVALAVFFAYRSARPLRVLLQAAKSLDATGRTIEPSRRPLPAGEYQKILEVLKSSGVALQSYETALTRQAELTRFYAFVTLLESGPSALPRHESYLLPLPARVAVIRPHPGAGVTGVPCEAALIAPLVREALPPGSLCYPVREDVVALVRERDDGEVPWLAALKEALAGMSRGIALSAPCEDAYGICEAYMRAYYRLRFHHDGEPDIVLGPAESADASDGGIPEALYRPQPTISRAAVTRLLLSGQADMLEQLLDEYEASLDASAGEDALRYVFYACTSAVAQFAGMPELELPAPPVYVPCDTGVEFAPLRRLLSDACAAIRAYQERAGVSRARAAMAFINENLFNTELYTRLVMEQIGISECELQAVVQKASGLSFFDYVEHARMAEARRLLEETDLPVSEIFPRCGYASRVTFSRAYRRFYGKSPSEQRLKVR